MISGESEFNEVFYTDAVCPKDERRRRRQQRLGGGDDAARLRARRGGGDDADPLPGRARPAARAGHASAASPTIRSSASGWRGATRKVQIMRYLGHAHADPVPRRPPSRARTAAISKLYWSEYHKVVTELGVDILGADALAPERAAARRRRSRPTTPARRTRRRRGSARSSTPGPARSTPARRRSSATSSARWCSACPKEPTARATVPSVARDVRGRRRRTVGAIARRPAALWPTALRQCAATRPRPGGGDGRRSCPCRRRDYLALPAAHAVRRNRDDRRVPTMW